MKTQSIKPLCCLRCLPFQASGDQIQPTEASAQETERNPDDVSSQTEEVKEEASEEDRKGEESNQGNQSNQCHP